MNCRNGHDLDDVGKDARGRCKECRRQTIRRWAKRHPEKVRQNDRRQRGMLGVPPEPPVGSPCEICKRPISGTPHADHDHATGWFRGWLCGGCNRGLGSYERPGWPEAAEEYLKAARLAASVRNVAG